MRLFWAHFRSETIEFQILDYLIAFRFEKCKDKTASGIGEYKCLLHDLHRFSNSAMASTTQPRRTRRRPLAGKKWLSAAQWTSNLESKRAFRYSSQNKSVTYILGTFEYVANMLCRLLARRAGYSDLVCAASRCCTPALSRFKRSFALAPNVREQMVSHGWQLDARNW